MDKLIMDRLSCHVTAKCNLRCKKCAVFIPKLYELKNIPEYSIEEIKRSFSSYFDIVEKVRLISLTGGEPMLYPHLTELIEFLKQFESRFEKLEVFTNGATRVPDSVFKAISKCPKMMLFVDNYGSDISVRANEIEEACKINGVKYLVRKYYGEDAHLGGWVDRSILPEKIDAETAKMHFEKCAVSKKGFRLFTIFGRKLAFCASPYCGLRTGEVPETDVLAIDLCDENTSPEDKKHLLENMDNVDFNPGCAWCNGLGVYENVERFIPGEQVEVR